MYKYIDTANTTTIEKTDNVGINVGIKDKILEYISNNPQITIPQLAQFLNVNDRTIERFMKKLREEGKIVREGCKKSGQWKKLRPYLRSKRTDYLITGSMRTPR
jgi:ATP-dependent DNA helicase RecG